MRAGVFRTAIALMALGLLTAGTAALAATKTGTSGNDKIDGTNQADTISGGHGNDKIRGLGGNDTLDGGPDSDSVDGGPGNDSVYGASCEYGTFGRLHSF